MNSISNIAFTHIILKNKSDSIGEQLQIESVREAATEVSDSIGFQTSITWEYGIHSVISDSIGFNFVKTAIKDVYTTILNSLKSTISYRTLSKEESIYINKIRR